MEIRSRLTKRFKAAQRLLHRDGQKSKASKSNRHEARGKKSFKERLLNLTQRLPGRSD